MMEKLKVMLAGLAVIAISMAALFGLYFLIWSFGAIGCWSSWKDSSIDYKYGLIGGCKVEISDGNWVQEIRYRAIN